MPERGVPDRGYGAIAQLGERLHGMQEVAGSIPPGSTTLRPSGYAWRSRAEPEGRSVGSVRRSPTGEDGLFQSHFPVNRGGRFSTKLATPSRKSLPRSDTTISLLASMVASASVWNGAS